MNRMMKISIALMVLLTLALCGCQKDVATTGAAGTTGATEPSSSQPAAQMEYSVTVADFSGKPYTSGVIVVILQGDQRVSMLPVNNAGTVSCTLPEGDYRVELQFTSTTVSYYYDESALKLSADQPHLDIQMVPKLSGTPVEIFDNNGAATALDIEAGQYYVSLTPGQRNYFLFAAKTAGTYRITTSDPEAVPGCYGYTAYIQDHTIAEVENGEMLLIIRSSMVGTEGMSNPYVIGVDAGSLNGCVLTIERIGDPPYSIDDDEPWIIYQATEELSPYVLPEGTLHEFDLTASGYNLVFNESDGFYHLDSADGPLVLVRLYSETTYLASFAEITSSTGVKKYFYDENGNFVKREDYTRCLKDYCEMSDDEEGLYPLTEDLKYILQGHGEYVGWWDSESPSFLFEDENGNPMVGLNTEIAWLFACCYLVQE